MVRALRVIMSTIKLKDTELLLLFQVISTKVSGLITKEMVKVLKQQDILAWKDIGNQTARTQLLTV